MQSTTAQHNKPPTHFIPYNTWGRRFEDMPGHTKLEPTINVEHKNSFSSYMSLDVVAALSFFLSRPISVLAWNMKWCANTAHAIFLIWTAFHQSRLNTFPRKQRERGKERTSKKKKKKSGCKIVLIDCRRRRAFRTRDTGIPPSWAMCVQVLGQILLALLWHRPTYDTVDSQTNYLRKQS